jgi:hypothetical protein
MIPQIEQFIESTQTFPLDKKSSVSDEPKWNPIYMGRSVAITVGTITFFLVSQSLLSSIADTNSITRFSSHGLRALASISPTYSSRSRYASF